MNWESLLFVVAICLGILPLLAVLGRVEVKHWQATAALVGLWVLFPVLMVVTAANNPRTELEEDTANFRPIEVSFDQYVGSKKCRSCHPHEHATWHSSYHRTMTQVATPKTVLGDFNDVHLSMNDEHFHLHRKGDEFWVTVDLPNSSNDPNDRLHVSWQIVMMTGSHHMQVYWFPPKNGVRYLGMLPFMYLLDEQRWIPRVAAFLQPAVESLDDEMGRWNEGCIRCHATRGEMGVQHISDVVDMHEIDTRVAEFGIACEACHGPGQKHVAANRDPRRRYQLHLASKPDDTIKNPRRMSHKQSSQVCGQCHAVSVFQNDGIWDQWAQHGYVYRPGDDLSQSKMRLVVQCSGSLHPRMQLIADESPDFLPNAFWSDGMVRVSGREYNGLLETPCYQHGQMSCLSCHQMHQDPADARHPKEWANDQLKFDMLGNHACVQCHEQFEDQQQLTAHTHHAPQSSGSLCYNCHMPYTSYGLLKAIRSHQVDTPSVDASLATGRPNACNQCHLDKTLAWSADQLQDWYGIERPLLDEDHSNIAASVLWLLRGDAGQRALMAWSYGWEEARQASGSAWQAPYLAQLLDDPYEAVRMIAHRSLRTLDGFDHLRGQKDEYDFLGPATLRQQAIQQSQDIWQRNELHRPQLRARGELLMDDDGNLINSEFQRLLNARDNRVISLNE